MAGCCGAAAAQAAAANQQKWVYTAPNGAQTTVNSEVEANILITTNGGGSKRQAGRGA